MTRRTRSGKVSQNSAAAHAGLRPGDVITQIDGINLSTNLHLDDFLVDHHANDIWTAPVALGPFAGGRS